MKKKTARRPQNKGVAKVPVVLQMETVECGAASLAMILAYYGKWLPLEQVRLDCAVSKDGSSAKNMVLAARNYGLDACGLRFEPETLKREGRFPCIVHWNFNHFVVLKGFKGNYAYLNDPARGDCRVSMEEFDAAFTGVCLDFAPSADFVPSGRPKSMLSFAKKRLNKAKSAVLFVFLVSLIAAIIELIHPVFSRVFLDVILEGRSDAQLSMFLLLFAVVALIELIAACMKAVYALRMNGRLAVVSTTTFLWKVLRMPMAFFSQRTAGDILRRQQSNEMIAERLVNVFAPLLLNLFMLVFYLAVMLHYSVLLTLIGVASIALDLLLNQLISKKRVNLIRLQMRDEAKMFGQTVAGMEMIETIKAGGAENSFFERWAGYQAGANTQNVRYTGLNQTLGALPAVVSAAAEVLIITLGVVLTFHGKFTVGMILAFQGLLQCLTRPTQALAQAGKTLQEMRAEMERVEDVMEYPEAFSPEDERIDGDVSYDKLSGRVELKNVTFGYAKLKPPLLKNFNLSLEPGSRVAIVGASGSGKSTVAKLISGLYQPWSGEILFDGQPITAINRTVFTGSLAAVDQDTILFEDTVANNIRMWDASIEDFEVIMAARDASLHEDIMQRNGGYNERLTEGGKNFSGGQRQRMEIARVLAADPTIMILDEATSALDAKTEHEVVHAINRREITCIVIAHRVSTIRDCDEIIVLDHGEVVERGTHEELYRRGGYYTALVSNE